MPTMSKEEMTNWILKFAVTQHGCKANEVAMLGWFWEPIAQLAAKGLADRALFEEALKYAGEQGWIEDGPQSTMFGITEAGYQRGSA